MSIYEKERMKMKCSVIHCPKEATDIIHIEMYTEIYVCKEHLLPIIRVLIKPQKEIISRSIKE